MQRVTPGIGIAFQAVEDALQYTFLPALFQGATSQIPGRTITGLPVKHSGIDFPDHNHTAGANCTVSCVIIEHLVAALRNTENLRSGDHALLMGEGREDVRQQHMEVAEIVLVEARSAASKTDSQRLGRIQRAGVWMSMILSTVNGEYLGAQEWRYSLFLRYNIKPHDLPDHCYGFRAAISIIQVLDCKKSELLLSHQNELHNGVANLAGKDFTPAHVHDDPKIFTCCAVRG